MATIRLFNHKFNLGLALNKTDFTLTFSNGSIIYFFGADRADEAEKLRGAVLNGVVVDEAQMYPLGDFAYLLKAVVARTLAVKKGRLIIVGTPGEVLAGEFYLATCTPPVPLGKDSIPSNYKADTEEGEGLWRHHQWTPQANLAAPHLWADALEEKRLRGWDDNNPTWRREYLGEWVASLNQLVYKFSYSRNVYDDLPLLPHDAVPWRYVLGVDLGGTDGTAMVVWAYSPDCPNLYEVYAEKICASPEQPITARFLSAWRQRLLEVYERFEMEVCDPGGLSRTLFLPTLADEYGVVWEPAETREKEDHIKLFNDDLEEQRILIRRNSPLLGDEKSEILGNRWEKDRAGNIPPVGSRKEDRNTPNDICDAALYAFRWCYHRFHRPKIKHVTPSAMMLVYEREREAIRRLQEGRIHESEDPCLLLL
jgi:hypothetical protein